MLFKENLKFYQLYKHTLEILQVQFQNTAIKYHNKVNCNLFTGGGSCLQSVKKTTCVKCNKTRYACINTAK